MPARPWTRMCQKCGREFKAKSNSRVYCFECSPPQVKGGGSGRKDGLPGGIGPSAPPTAPSKDIPSAQEVEDEKTPPELLQITARRNYSKVRRNGKGMVIDTGGRPPGGWGKCRSVDPVSREENCESERFNVSCPFCFDHMRWWREEEMKRKGVAIADKIMRKVEEKKTVAGIDTETFEVETAADALKLLSKLNLMLAREQLLPDTVRAIRENVLAQIRAIDTMMASDRFKLLAELKARKKNDPIEDDELDEENLELDLDLARRTLGDQSTSSDQP